MTLRTKNPLSGNLIEVAKSLADMPGNPGLKQAAFKRAISSAYYALFHSLCQVCCSGLGLWNSDPADLDSIYRTLDHGKARQILGASDVRTMSPELARICDCFMELKRMREDADYSPPGRLGGTAKLLTRKEALALIEAASEAVMLMDALPSGVRRRLAILLVSKLRPTSSR